MVFQCNYSSLSDDLHCQHSCMHISAVLQLTHLSEIAFQQM
jgi:hypothetical protein